MPQKAFTALAINILLHDRWVLPAKPSFLLRHTPLFLSVFEREYPIIYREYQSIMATMYINP